MLYCFFPPVKRSEITTFYDQYGAIPFCVKSWLLHSVSTLHSVFRYFKSQNFNYWMENLTDYQDMHYLELA